MTQAAGLEASTPEHAVTPGPTVLAYELLGDLLLELGEPSDALTAYRRALELYPRLLNSVVGAARSARAEGNTQTARRYYGELIDGTSPESRRESIKEGRAYLSQ